MLKEIRAKDIKLGDHIHESRTTTHVTKIEFRLCGIHVNGSACYNDVEAIVKVSR